MTNNKVIYVISESFEDNQYAEASQRFTGMYSGVALTREDSEAFVEKRKQEQLELWNIEDKYLFVKNDNGTFQLIVPEFNFEYTWVIKAEMPFAPKV